MSNTSVETIEAAIRQALSTHGPMGEDELLAILLADGVDLGPDAGDLLADVLDGSDDLVMGLLNETFAFLPALLDGRVFTHRLSALEAEHDMLAWSPDLSAISMLTENETYLQLTDGSPIVDAMPGLDDGVLEERGISPYDVDDEGALLFERGRIAGLGVGTGDLIGLRVSATGLDLIAIDDVADDETNGGAGARIAEVFEEHAEGPMMLGIAVWTALASDVDLLREPAKPLGEQLVSSRLTVDGEWVAREGFSFDAWRGNNQVRLMKSRYGLHDDEALALLGAIGLYERTRGVVDFVLESPHEADDTSIGDVADHLLSQQGSGTIPTADGETDLEYTSAVLAFLEEPMVVEAFLAETASGDHGAPIALELFAESMERAAPRSARPAMRWLRGKAYEALGSVEQAEDAFRAAQSLNPSWPPTLMSLARYASDRGDAVRGLTLLRRAGAPPEHPLVQLLEEFQPTAGPTLGRNEPCWCGSGRKYKQCHIHGGPAPLSERASWLYQKAGLGLVDGPFTTLLIDAAQERARHWDNPDALAEALEDGLAPDAVLFEGGAFEYFLAVRGSLLPADEVLLAQQWLLVERSVHEVVSVRPGESMTWRDVRTGDVAEIRERSASQQVKPGELYCARVVPAGETTQIFGGLEPVSLGERDTLITLLDNDPDPLELVEFLSRRFAPPVVLNSEGDPIVFCEATLRVSDPDTLAGALDAEYDREHEAQADMPVWFEHITTNGMQRIRAELDLRANELRIHTNSEARFERAFANILRLDPGATTLTETREPADFRPTEEPDVSGAAVSASPFGLPEDPAMVSALEEMILQFEEGWLDDHIPALGGYTPRECAEDPTRRPDLIKLLDSFPQDDKPGQMSVTRLRSALGLGLE